jgi:hypothetical protein
VENLKLELGDFEILWEKVLGRGRILFEWKLKYGFKEYFKR